MPLFFLVSGFLASSALSRSWKQLWSGKFAVWIWLYVLWSCATLVAGHVLPSPRGGGPIGGDDVAAVFVWPSTGIWYLYALPVFLFLLRCTRRLASPVVIASAACISLAFIEGVLATGNFALDYMGRNVVFFALGARMPRVVAGFADRVSEFSSRRFWLFFTAATLGTMLVVGTYTALSRQLDPVPIGRSAMCVMLVVVSLSAAVRWADGPLGRLLGLLGRRTLEIYVAHEMIMGVVAAGLLRVDVGDVAGADVWVTPLLAVIGIAGALLLHRAVGRVPGLYSPPQRFTSSSVGALQRT